MDLNKNYDNTIYINEIEIYKLVLNGKLKYFPKRFWTDPESKKYGISITKYLVEEVLKLEESEVVKKIRKTSFTKNKLGGMLNSLYNNSPVKAIMSAYPEKNYHEWFFVNAPNNFWQGEEGKKNGVKATKWLFDEKLKWSKEDIKNKVTHQVFKDNDLLGMIRKAFNGSIWECINYVYPNEFKPWEIGDHVQNEYWTLDKAIESIKWLFEEKLKWSVEDVKKNLCKQTFINHNLNGMIQEFFNGSPYEAYNSVYQNKILPWELNKVPLSFWEQSDENIKNGVRWLINKKLKWSDKDIRDKYSGVTLKENGFSGILKKYSSYEILTIAFPERNYKPWLLKSFPNDYWQKDTVCEAVKWLVETKLNISVKEAKKLKKQVFLDNRLKGVLQWFDGEISDLIDYVYFNKSI